MVRSLSAIDRKAIRVQLKAIIGLQKTIEARLETLRIDKRENKKELKRLKKMEDEIRLKYKIPK